MFGGFLGYETRMMDFQPTPFYKFLCETLIKLSISFCFTLSSIIKLHEIFGSINIVGSSSMQNPEISLYKIGPTSRDERVKIDVALLGYKRASDDGPRHFEPWRSDVDDI
ncbi:hypothetical protein TNCV_4771341 [Trichonephila clavipes]|nr:hypothetical protein TNCV_4771341 [Trichonephila clavipes]